MTRLAYFGVTCYLLLSIRVFFAMHSDISAEEWISPGSYLEKEKYEIFKKAHRKFCKTELSYGWKKKPH